MTGFRESQLLEAVDLLLNARRTMTPINDLPSELKPASLDEVFFVQDRIREAHGALGGWKVGASSPDAVPMAAPLPLTMIAQNGAVRGGRLRGLEAEIAFVLKSDLPPRATPYRDEEVYAAVGSCHPAIEVLESALADPTRPEEKLTMLADLQMHGGLISGARLFVLARPWISRKEHVTLAIDGMIRLEETGSNTCGDLKRLLPWLANEGSARTGGLLAGQCITTGSWTGNYAGALGFVRGCALLDGRAGQRTLCLAGRPFRYSLALLAVRKAC